MNPWITHAGELAINQRTRGRSWAVYKFYAVRGWILGVLFATVTTAGATGCQPTGTWRLAKTDPPGVPFPLQELTLDASGHFAATSTAYGERIPSQGMYRWRGRTLEVGRAGFEPRSYTIKRRWDGRLEFIHEENGRRVSAFFERVDPDEASAPSEVGEADATPAPALDFRAVPEPPKR